MRTPETQATFNRDIAATTSMPGRTTEFIRAALAQEHARHAAYDAAFDRMVAEVQAIEPNSRGYVRDILNRIGDAGCRSGTAECHAAHVALSRMSITDPHQIFEHDLRFIAATYLPVKVRRAA